MSNKHTQIHPHTLSHTHTSPWGRCPASTLRPRSFGPSGLWGGSGFVFGGSGCQPGVQQALQTPLHRLIICHLCFFSFLLVVNVDLCLQKLIRSVQRAAPELLTTNKHNRWSRSVWTSATFKPVEVILETPPNICTSKNKIVEKGSKVFSQSRGEQSEPPPVRHPSIIHHSNCSSIIHLQIVPSKPENELLWPDFVLLIIENWEMRTYTSRNMTSWSTGKRERER